MNCFGMIYIQSIKKNTKILKIYLRTEYNINNKVFDRYNICAQLFRKVFLHLFLIKIYQQFMSI